ncbi:hypothetical protein EV175_002868 [Coemansia sp. RSA 1933]|nr:hypothetical protein EV175_002868 [Coemansia sp. RSA 1933]
MSMRIAESVGFYLILPFMYEMVGGFDIVHDPRDIAFYAGVLLASFSVLKILTVMHWGILSDRIGRRPVVLIGLLGDLLTSALFGVSKSFGWAMVARCMNGFFTSSSVVIRPILVEISDETNRARMMSYSPMVWQLGSMLGGAIGGLLANPVKKYPWLFGNSVLFREYPYLLPCLFGSAISFVGLVVGFFFLEETLVVKPTTAPGSGSASETTPLVSEAQSEEGRAQINAETGELSRWDILTPTVIRVLFTNTILCLAVGMHTQLYPIFAATDVAVGGLGMDTQTIGITFMVCSGFALYTQLVKYPREERKYGALDCYRRGLLWTAVFGATLPLIASLEQYLGKPTGSNIVGSALEYVSPGRCLIWGLLLIEFYVRMYGDALGSTSVNLITANVVPSKNYLGFITGLQKQLNSITFLLGPFLSGYLWSWSIKHSFPYPFNSHFVWVLSGASLVVAWYMTRSIPDSVNVSASDNNPTNASQEETS